MKKRLTIKVRRNVRWKTGWIATVFFDDRTLWWTPPCGSEAEAYGLAQEYVDAVQKHFREGGE